jgi:hypothetical protein
MFGLKVAPRTGSGWFDIFVTFGDDTKRGSWHRANICWLGTLQLTKLTSFANEVLHVNRNRACN